MNNNLRIQSDRPKLLPLGPNLGGKRSPSVMPRAATIAG